MLYHGSLWTLIIGLAVFVAGCTNVPDTNTQPQATAILTPADFAAIVQTQLAITQTPDAPALADLPDYDLSPGMARVSVSGARNLNYTHRGSAARPPVPFSPPIYTTNLQGERTLTLWLPYDMPPGATDVLVVEIRLPQGMPLGAYDLAAIGDGPQPSPALTVLVRDRRDGTAFDYNVTATATLDRADHVLLNGRFDLSAESRDGERIQMTLDLHAIPYTPQPSFMLSVTGTVAMTLGDAWGYNNNPSDAFRFFASAEAILPDAAYQQASIFFEIVPGARLQAGIPYDLTALVIPTVRFDDETATLQAGTLTFDRIQPYLKGKFSLQMLTEAGTVVLEGSFDFIPNPFTS